MTAFSVRTDPEVDSALDEMGVTSGNRSKVVKEAILLLAEHRRSEALRAEAQRLASDPDDLAEVRAIQEMFEGDD